MDDVLSKLRNIRKQENILLKPSPFLKSNYINDAGTEEPVSLRNYQKQMVLNLLNMDRFIVADDVGLGKSLEVLTTIGYIWMKEPEYVPIILVRKSALLQWALECNKFMQNIEVTTISGEPYERHKMYENFFNNPKSGSKRILIMTYNMLVRDMGNSLVRNRDFKASKEKKKEYKLLRKEMLSAKKELNQFKPDFHSRFDSKHYEIRDFVVARMKSEQCKIPPDWTPEDEQSILTAILLKARFKELESKTEELKNEIEPPEIVLGLEHYAKEFLRKNKAKILLVSDEIHIAKNHKSQFHEKIFDLSKISSRVYGLTATPVKNKLMEFFSLFRIIAGGLFPKISHFQNSYCVTKLQPIPGGRKIPVVVGYKNLDDFVQKIEPYYLSRRKHEVAKELPELLTREIRCELYDLQEELYDLAENGLLEKGEDPDVDSTEILKAMTLVQQAVNSPKLIKNSEIDELYDGPSSKIDNLLDLLDGELNGVKTIIFSKFEKMVTLVGEELKKNKIKFVRITGAENTAVREKNKQIFQDAKSGVDIILITTAGAESINLQSAEHFILIDSPWSWGDYVQLLGRMVRIGSKYSMVVVSHLVAIRQSGKKTIDQHVLKILKTKKHLSDKVSGEALKDGLNFIKKSDEIMDIFHMIKSGQMENEEALKQVSNLKQKETKTSKVKERKTVNVESLAIPTINFDDI